MTANRKRGMKDLFLVLRINSSEIRNQKSEIINLSSILMASPTVFTLLKVTDSLLSVSFIRQLAGFLWTKCNICIKVSDLKYGDSWLLMK